VIATLDDLPPPLAATLRGRDLIVFDGECVLCSAFFHFMLRHDTYPHFAYATAQSSLGQGLYAALGLPLDDFETNLVIVNGRIHGHLDAFAAAMARLGGGWRLLSVLRFLPGFIKRPAYRLIARNRYRLFGRYDTCLVPDAALRGRFLPGGF
jgi:predicted DCC family thiol-disulfide oxidoreductase YuxK